ncbi:hypothetical protein LNQ52_20545 [Klebsiella pneumoniae subsp. pneumoniae]|nr:hypothetical protein [Klebsiella pneumoniae subsp. pneumoniae]
MGRCSTPSVGLAQEKRTMVIVTHEMSFARDVADPGDIYGSGTHCRTRRGKSVVRFAPAAAYPSVP